MPADKLNRIERLPREKQVELIFDLINSFSIVKNPIETAFFLQDLLTPNEIRNLALRLRLAKLLLAGKTYEEIQQETHASSATITKISIWLGKGGEGFKKVIAKLPLKWDIPRNLPRGPVEFHLPQFLLALTQHAVSTTQNRRVEKFIEKTKEKEDVNKGVQKIYDEYYRSKH